MRRLLPLLALPLVICFATTLLFAQMESATVSGRITDPLGAVIANAEVQATNIDTNVTRTTRTNSSGIYVVPNLAPGSYRLTISSPGFKQIVKTGLILHVQDTISQNFAMNVGSAAESITVTAEAANINKSDGTVATVVDRRFVENMPLNGRSFQSLINLTPGIVITVANSFNKGQFSVNGQRSNANYLTVDGVSANIGANAADGISQDFSGTLPGFNASGSTSSLVSIDALQEFKIQTSTYAPEFGRTPGAQVSMVTRSGTNQLHGTVFEYFRNDALDSADWFVNNLGQRKPALRQNDFGFVLGGPVVIPHLYDGRNHTFFFLSYEGLRLRLPKTANTFVVATRVRQNAPATMQPILNAFPVPTGAEIGTTGQAPFAKSYSDPSSSNAGSVRIDKTVNDRLSFFGRYNNSPSTTLSRSLSTVTTTEIHTQTTTLGATLTLSPQLSNEFRANYSRVIGRTLRDIDNFAGAVPFDKSLLIPSFALNGRSAVAVTLVTLGVVDLGFYDDNIQRQVNLVDNLYFGAGSHRLKFGVDYRRLSPIYKPRDYSQSAIFSNQTAILTGTASLAATFAIKRSNPLFNNVSAYGQDTWQVAPRLALTYGLRWDVNPAPSEGEGNLPFALTGVSNKATIALAPSGQPLYKTTWGNVAPRVGAAYQLVQKSGRELVLRGGFGVFYDIGSGQAPGAFTRYPFATRIVGIPGLPYPLSPANAALPPFDYPPPLQITGFDPNLELPYTMQWNVSLGQSLGSNQTLSASYVAAAGRRLLRTQTMSNPNPTFQLIVFTNNEATSDYHALQVQFHRRLSRGLQALTSYTWAHAIDEISDETSGTVTRDISRGNAEFDIRHTLSTAISYDLPGPRANPITKHLLGNWAIDFTVRAQSGAPFAITSGTEVDPILGRTFARRVNVTAGIPLYVNDPTAPGGKRLNDAIDPARPGCKGPFCPAPAGQQGDLARNSLRGFAVYQTDFALRRQFDFSERVKLQFRAEAFNLFNHPNFALPENSLTSANFGRATRTLATGLSTQGAGLSSLYQIGGPRSMQLALRVTF